MKAQFLWLFAALLALSACGGKSGRTSPSVHRGVYHWKTTYDPTNWEKQWMKDHKVDKLYVKLFDVEAGYKASEPGWKMVPVATTLFKQKLPTGIEVVPVVYITVDAIRAVDEGFWGNYEEYARLIVKRIDDMMGEHYGGKIKEVQLDCDWTQQTEHAYFMLAKSVKELLHDRDIILSGTLRLHQLREVICPTKNEFGCTDSIPFDRSLLMCYNTGRLQDPRTDNSILDFNDVKPYLKQYPLDSLPRTDVAYPVYGWGVMFYKLGGFKRLVNSRNMPSKSNDSVRVEWGEPGEIGKTQRALPILDDNRTTILYHLDSLNLSRYSHEDIEAFYSR